MEIVGPNSMCQDIQELYRDMYQLCRLLMRGRCEEGMEEHLCQEILESIKEHLQLKQPSTPPEAEQKQFSANTP